MKIDELILLTYIIIFSAGYTFKAVKDWWYYKRTPKSRGADPFTAPTEINPDEVVDPT